MRHDQVKELARLGITPSFFLAHVYHWGDVHMENLGMERARRTSPMRDAEEKQIPFTLHQDSPVIPPDMMETVWCAVNRKTKNGVVLGGEQKLSAYEALQAITIHAAKQYGEEQEKGTIALVGKRGWICEKGQNRPHDSRTERYTKHTGHDDGQRRSDHLSGIRRRRLGKKKENCGIMRRYRSGSSHWLCRLCTADLSPNS